MNRRLEAEPYIERVLAIREDPDLRGRRWWAAAVDGDPRAEELRAAAEAAMPADRSLAMRATLARWNGQLEAYAALVDEQRSRLRAARDEGRLSQLELDVQAGLAAYGDAGAQGRLRQALAGTLPLPLLAETAVLVAALGDVDGARPVLARLEAGPDRPDVRGPATVLRAYMKAADGRVTDAIADLEALQRQEPMNVAIGAHLGQIRERAGDLEGAAADYAAIIERRVLAGPDVLVAVVRHRLGSIRLKQERLDEARGQFDLLLEQWKDADTEFELLKDVRALRQQAG